jgi:dTMP kinase
LTKEPGGSAQSAQVRELVLGAKGKLGPEAELLLFLADRAQHVRDTLIPGLKAGKMVLCDRYSDSTFAYQGGGRGFKRPVLEALNAFAAQGLKPDLTLLFDIDGPSARRRQRLRGKAKDRMEGASLQFHKRVRAEFLRMARSQPKRIKVIAVGDKRPDEVLAEAFQHVEKFL